jgi:ribose transport system substrate-binding protein
MQTTTRPAGRWRATLAVSLILASVALAGCGSSSSSSSNSSAASSGGSTTSSADPSSTSGSSGAQQAAAKVNAAKATPKFFHGPAFNTSAAKGKTVWYIGNQSSNIIQEWTSETKAALSSQGVNLRVYDPGAAVADHIKGFQLAISNHAAAIILGDGYSPVVFEAQVKQAKAAGIPFFSLVAGSTPEFPPKAPDLTLDVSYDYYGIGKLLADWFIADSGGKGDVYLIETPDIPSSTYELEGFQAEVKALAPSVKVTLSKFNQESTSDQGQSQFTNLAQTAIEKDPGLKYIITAFDSQALDVQAGIQQAGAASRVKTAGFNSIVPQMENLKKGNTPFKMDIGGVNVWLAYALADDVMRAIAGQPLVKDPHVGVRVFEHDNVQSLNVTAENDQAWYGVDYPKLYETEVWKP